MIRTSLNVLTIAAATFGMMILINQQSVQAGGHDPCLDHYDEALLHPMSAYGNSNADIKKGCEAMYNLEGYVDPGVAPLCVNLYNDGCLDVASGNDSGSNNYSSGSNNYY